MLEALTRKEWLDKVTSVVPSKRQLEWQSLEFTAFFHYGINSFTDREWGDGKEDISVFNPRKFNADNWCESLVLAGIKACIITAKHHDGFCLWDTKYSNHSVMHTPFKRDIVRELSISCEKYGIKLGVYLSPWDRHEKTYGLGKEYDDYFCNQLTELLTSYGPLYTVWFDGACGEGENGKKQIYDWERYYKLIRDLQADAVISISGPDVRWCGNEAGDCRESEWSVVDAALFDQKKIQESSQSEDDTMFREKKISEMDLDLGSREALKDAKEFIWYPAEVDTSIRPGWFYHESEDCKVKSFEELKRIYLNAVGGNCVLLLNIPPHKDGYITEFDRSRLKELGDFIRNSFKDNVAKEATTYLYTKDNRIMVLPGDKVTKQSSNQYMLHLIWEEEKDINYVVLKEHIKKGQRIEKFIIQGKQGDEWVTIASGTTVGYKKICEVGLKTKELQIWFQEYRNNIYLEAIEVYESVNT